MPVKESSHIGILIAIELFFNPPGSVGIFAYRADSLDIAIGKESG